MVQILKGMNQHTVKIELAFVSSPGPMIAILLGSLLETLQTYNMCVICVSIYFEKINGNVFYIPFFAFCFFHLIIHIEDSSLSVLIKMPCLF